MIIVMLLSSISISNFQSVSSPFIFQLVCVCGMWVFIVWRILYAFVAIRVHR